MRSAVVFESPSQTSHYLPVGDKRHTVGTDLAEYYRRRAEVSDACAAGIVFVRSEAGVAVFPAGEAYKGHCWRVGGDADVAPASPKRVRVPHRLSGGACGPGGCGSAASLLGNDDTTRLEKVIRKVLREEREEFLDDIKTELINFLRQSTTVISGTTEQHRLSGGALAAPDPDTSRRSDMLQHSADTVDDDLPTVRAESQPSIFHSLTGLNCQYARSPLTESEQDATPRAPPTPAPVSPVFLDPTPTEPSVALPSPAFTPVSTPPVPSSLPLASPPQPAEADTLPPVSEPVVLPAQASAQGATAAAPLGPQGHVSHAHYCEVSPQAPSDRSTSLNLLVPTGQSPQPSNNSVSVIVGSMPPPPPSFVTQRPATVGSIHRQATPTAPAVPEVSRPMVATTPVTTPHHPRPPTPQQLYGSPRTPAGVVVRGSPRAPSSAQPRTPLARSGTFPGGCGAMTPRTQQRQQQQQQWAQQSPARQQTPPMALRTPPMPPPCLAAAGGGLPDWHGSKYPYPPSYTSSSQGPSPVTGGASTPSYNPPTQATAQAGTPRLQPPKPPQQLQQPVAARAPQPPQQPQQPPTR